MGFQRASTKTDAHVPMVFGIAGPQGSGKTYSALRLATGLADPERIFFVDTEGGRALMYRSEFDFQHQELTEPYTPGRYQEAIQEAIGAGARVVIVDSMSHEHEGPGGLLEQAEQALQKNPKTMPWGWLKPQRNRFINWLMSQKVLILLCFQARPKTKPEKNQKGETVMVDKGFQPICGLEYMFALTGFTMMMPSAPGVPDFSNQDKPMMAQLRPCFPDGQPISEQTGQCLRRWLESGGSGTATPAQESTDAAAFAELYQEAQQQAEKGAQAFRAWWKQQPQTTRDSLKPYVRDFQERAQAVDGPAEPASS